MKEDDRHVCFPVHQQTQRVGQDLAKVDNFGLKASMSVPGAKHS